MAYLVHPLRLSIQSDSVSTWLMKAYPTTPSITKTVLVVELPQQLDTTNSSLRKVKGSNYFFANWCTSGCTNHFTENDRSKNPFFSFASNWIHTDETSLRWCGPTNLNDKNLLAHTYGEIKLSFKRRKFSPTFHHIHIQRQPYFWTRKNSRCFKYILASPQNLRKLNIYSRIPYPRDFTTTTLIRKLHILILQICRCFLV